MNEDQIERRVEKMMDHLDAAFLSGEMITKNYNHAGLNQWAEARYAEIKKAAASSQINLEGHLVLHGP